MSKVKAKDRMEQAFFELLEEKHYSKISVSELIEKSGVSRTTFYRNYEDVFDMYKKVCDHMLSEFLVVIFSATMEMKDFNAVEIFDKICAVLNVQKKYIMLLSGENGDRYFYERIFSIIYENINKLPFKFTQQEIFKFKFIVYAGVASYVDAIMQGKDLMTEVVTMSRMIYKFDEFGDI